MTNNCTWPSGVCKCWESEQKKPQDHAGRVWMHCEEGLAMTKASMARFMLYCLEKNIEIGSVHAFNSNYKGSLVLATIRLRPDQFEEFETETRGKLRKPPTIKLN